MVDEQMLAAAETLILYSREPVILPPANPRDLRPTLRHPALARLETIPPSIPSWKGFRSRRSRCSCASKPATEEDDSSGPAAKTRPSPSTPLEFCAASAPSTSGSDAAPSSPAIPEAKRRRAGDPSSPSGDACQTQKVIVAELLPPPPPLVRAAVPLPKPIRRQGKKKTISELQAQERTLAEENAKLRERVAAKRREMEALMAENRRLMGQKSSLHHSRAADRVAEPRFLLPDLNEPVMEA